MKTCATLLLIFCSGVLWAQLTEGAPYGEGEAPVLRERHFEEIRRFEDGSLPDTWAAFRQLRSRLGSRSSAIPAANWQSLGPNTLDSLAGRMACHAFNPFDPQTILAASSTGGLWKTTNGAESWFPLADELPSLRISAVAYHPQDTNHLLIGTGNYMGNSFTLRAGVGLLESFDGGQSWEPNAFSYPFADGVSVSRIRWDAENPNNIYLAASNGFWVSRDGGASWRRTLSGLVSDLEQDPQSPNRLFAAVHSDGLYRSTDAGENWQKLQQGLPAGSQSHRINLALCDSFPNFLLASIVSPSGFGLQGLYKSSDGGDSWGRVSNPPSYLCNGGCLGWFVNMVAISPVDTNVILLGGPRLYRTADGGQSWQWVDYYSNGVGPSNIGLAYVDQWDAGFDPSGPSIVYVFNDGGVQKSYDKGRFWIKKNQGLVTAQFYRLSSYPKDTSLLIGGLQDHGLYFLDNSGGNIDWDQWYIGDGCALSFDPNNPSRVYGDNIFGVHYRSNNVTAGLFSTTAINNGITGSNSVAFHFVTTHHPTESNILYTANDDHIFKTTTGGLIWNTAANISDVRAIEISPVDPNTIYAASWDNSTWNFYRSFDAGLSWETTNSAPGWRVTDIEADPKHFGVIYATRNSAFPGNPHVYRSADHGDSWTPISNGLPDVSTNAVTVNPFLSEVVYLGTDLGVFISEDSGQSWSEYNDNLPPYYVMDMHYHPLDSTLRIGTLGRGAWKTKSIPEVIISSVEVEWPDLSTVFPNPFREEVQIGLHLRKRQRLRLSILNGMGQEMAVLHDGALSEGPHQFQWDGRNAVGRAVSAGLYFVQLYAGNRKQVMKVVKAH